MGEGEERQRPNPSQGSDNPRLLRQQFPFLTQWPLAVRADLRALVKSADSSLAGSQRHLGLAENTSLRRLGEKQQPEERSSQPSRERLRAGRTFGILPHKGSFTPQPQQGCRDKEGTPKLAQHPPSGQERLIPCPELGPGAGTATVPTRARTHATVGVGGRGAGRKAAAAPRQAPPQPL